MEIGSVTSAGAMLPNQAKMTGGEKVEEGRRESSLAMDEPARDQKQVSSEEILSKINELTEDGIYSVRFEKNKEINDLVAQVVDRESGEVIRQIPAEEILKLSKRLEDLRGGIIDTTT
ncbi:MAG: flagellar protein FlaG [Desulfuromonadaceae bacterium]|jgi:flagellar protein FlaG